MIEYALTDDIGNVVEVRLPATDDEGRAPIEYDGLPAAVELVRSDVEASPGRRAQPIGPATTRRDLDYAMNNALLLRRYRPRRIERPRP